MNWRGGEQQLSYMLEELKLLEVNLIVLSPKKSEVEKHCMAKNINYISLKKTHTFSLKWAKTIQNISIKKNIDIIHTHDSKAHTYAVLASVLFANKKPIVVHRKVIFKIKQNFLTKFKYNYKQVKKIICISKAVQNEVLKIVKNDNTILIYSAIKHDDIAKVNLRKKYDIPIQNKIIGYVAALSFEKDHSTFLKTAKQLLKSNSNLNFIIVGDGKLKKTIQSQITQLNIEKSVILTGFIKNAKYLINQFDVLLFTSKSEGLGSTILDAFYQKIPVVTVKNGGGEELVLSNDTGYICNKEAVLCLQKNVEKALNNKKEVTRITENAFELVKKRHSTRFMATKLVRVYLQIVKMN
ncbi:MAG: glycosyltransferase [Flavobacteriaceae bacterium]|nr:glycosyltransferase [Flavobacteriaceae bacterium]